MGLTAAERPSPGHRAMTSIGGVADILVSFVVPRFLATVALVGVLRAAAGLSFCMEGASPTAAALLCASAALAAVYWYELDALALLDHVFSAVGAALGRMRAALA